MAGAGANFTLETDELKELIKETGAAIKDMSPVTKAFGEYMVRQTDQRFRDEESPAGVPWAKLSPVTEGRKQKKNKIDKILQQDGYLRLVHPETGRDHASVESDKVYAAIHNYGGEAGKNHSVYIKKREFLGFSDQDIQEFMETAKDYILMEAGQ